MLFHLADYQIYNYIILITSKLENNCLIRRQTVDSVDPIDLPHLTSPLLAHPYQHIEEPLSFAVNLNYNS